MRARTRTALAVTSTVLALGAAAAPAGAATGEGPNPAGNGQGIQTLDCSGLGTIQVRTNTDRSSERGGWSSATIVGGGSGKLIPTSFDFSAYDETADLALFEGYDAKGGGHGNQQQGPVLTCVQDETATLADVLEPGDTPPPGTEPTDTVRIMLTVTAVQVG